MKKLNNQGWGLGLMLVFLGVFVLAIIIIVIQANSLGIAGELQYATPIPTKTPVATEIPVSTPIPNGNQGSSYLELENRSERAAETYRERYYTSLQDGDSVYVEVRKLVADQLLSELISSSGETCSGYVKISNSGIFTYDAYLKCGSYETEGYLSYLDN